MTAAAQDPPAPRPQQVLEAPVPAVAFSAGFSYLQTDLLNTPGVANTYTLGWYAMPQYYFTRHLSAIGEFDDLGNYHAHAGENVRAFLGGPEWTFATMHHVQPFVFTEGGAVRDSRDNYINWMASAAGGIGFNTRISKSVSFQLIPAEYVASKQTDGDWSGNLMAKAGFTFNGFRWKR
ncbi:BTB/POZ domain-containing protein [Silvibacterium dinghuense]|uniref:Uncharacterized protein n=1 Tax=Silvibacterium dinghuense TaxID=1560006 RepID=A0A4Q1S9K6_9BACT|nr:BTB/POZ domain-containing protein [Silvibacterium dinghuense]RXS93746.1 hypothetical protein ESZ00_17000 [Silvibacterium dinghuense]GGH07309.1 hypothetical protein GCM10011586_24480 [Silvibacterium dinghuense]